MYKSDIKLVAIIAGSLISYVVGLAVLVQQFPDTPTQPSQDWVCRTTTRTVDSVTSSHLTICNYEAKQ